MFFFHAHVFVFLVFYIWSNSCCNNFTKSSKINTMSLCLNNLDDMYVITSNLKIEAYIHKYTQFQQICPWNKLWFLQELDDATVCKSWSCRSWGLQICALGFAFCIMRTDFLCAGFNLLFWYFLILSFSCIQCIFFCITIILFILYYAVGGNLLFKTRVEFPEICGFCIYIFLYFELWDFSCPCGRWCCVSK